MNASNRTSRAFLRAFWPVLGLTLALLAPAQTGEETPTDRRVFVKETLTFLKVGLPDSRIMAYWDRKGWPASVKDLDFVRLRDAGAGGALQNRIRGLLAGHAVFSRLAEQYEPFEASLSGGTALSVLRPRGWHMSRSRLGDRFTFHEHSAQLPGWFRKTSVFIWAFDRATWKKGNEKALARIVFSSVRKRLEKAGISVGPMKESRLILKRDKREFPVAEAICRDPRDKLKGILALGARVDDVSGKIIVIGFATRLIEDPVREDADKRDKPRDILAQMLATIRVSKP